MDKKKLNERAMKATARLMKNSGKEILEEGYHGHVVAMDEGTLVFCLVEVSEGSDVMVSTGFDHMRFEKTVFEYLLEHDEIVDCPIRGDVACLAVMGANRAMVRYMTNVAC